MPRPVIPFLLAAVLVLGGALVGLISVRNYRGVRNLVERDPPSPLLRSVGGTGVPGLQAVSFPGPVMPASPPFRLAGWYVPPAVPPGPAVVVLHGTNSDRSTMLPEIRLLAAAGIGVLAFDWPGLGESGGSVRWDGQARATVETAVGWLAGRPEVDPHRLGGLGFSIGGYVLAQVGASDARLRAMVLEAAPPDFDDYLQMHDSRWGVVSRWPARWAMQDMGLLDPALAPVTLVAKISPRPLLLLANSADPEVSAAMVRRLFEAARQPKELWILSAAQHGGYSEIAGREYARRLTDFFVHSLAPSP